MQKIITSISILKAAEGNKLSYTFSEIDVNGSLLRTNVRESFIIVDQEILDLATKLEQKVNQISLKNFRAEV